MLTNHSFVYFFSGKNIGFRIKKDQLSTKALPIRSKYEQFRIGFVLNPHDLIENNPNVSHLDWLKLYYKSI